MTIDWEMALLNNEVMAIIPVTPPTTVERFDTFI
jgi:hypothetical protein